MTATSTRTAPAGPDVVLDRQPHGELQHLGPAELAERIVDAASSGLTLITAGRDATGHVWAFTEPAVPTCLEIELAAAAGAPAGAALLAALHAHAAGVSLDAGELVRLVRASCVERDRLVRAASDRAIARRRTPAPVPARRVAPRPRLFTRFR